MTRRCGVTYRISDFNVARGSIQVRLPGFGAGGLIQAAVGLLGGIGGLLTKRSGLSRLSPASRYDVSHALGVHAP